MLMTASAKAKKEERAARRMAHLDERIRYTITVEGTVDPSLADWCGPLTIAAGQGPSGATVTTLSGIQADQAGLVGIIRHLHGLGIVLLAIERCERGALPQAVLAYKPTAPSQI
jgi:hypothetical protein